MLPIYFSPDKWNCWFRDQATFPAMAHGPGQPVHLHLPPDTSATGISLPACSWSKWLADTHIYIYISTFFQYFLRQKVLPVFTLTFFLGRVQTPFSRTLFSLLFFSLNRWVFVLEEGVQPSSWALAEANIIAGCSLRLPSSY